MNFLLNLFISFTYAASTTVSTGGGVAASGSIGSWVQNFYNIALAIGGILAFGGIIYGGVRYSIGKGNPSSESEGRSWITNALLGLLLLGSAWIILYTVNPQIITLKIQGLSQLQPPPAPVTVTESNSPIIEGCVASNTAYVGGQIIACNDGSAAYAQACNGKQISKYPAANTDHSCGWPPGINSSNGNPLLPRCIGSNIACYPPHQCVINANNPSQATCK